MKFPARTDLSQEQESILMSAPLDGAILVYGPPGSGKTVIAMFRALAVTRSSSILPRLVMFNNVLNSYASAGLRELGLSPDIGSTWHSWFYGWWRKAYGRNPPEIGRFTPDWSQALQAALSGGGKSESAVNWGHLIIDEGQDFAKEFYLLINAVRRTAKCSAERSITVLADENQRLQEEGNSSLKEIAGALSIGESQKFRLTRNFRNTAEIAKLAAQFYVGLSSGIPETPDDRYGDTPVLREFDDLDDEAASIVRFAKNNDDFHVGVFAPDTRSRREILKAMENKNRGTGGSIRLQTYGGGGKAIASKLDFEKGGTITVLCEQSCKGLEFDAVFIPQLQKYPVDAANEIFGKMKLYVMCSRARSTLTLSFSGCNESPAILSMLPDHKSGLLDWQTS